MVNSITMESKARSGALEDTRMKTEVLPPAGAKRYYDTGGGEKTFTASNGMKVAPAKNRYVKTMRKIASNMGVERMNVASYRANMNSRHADTDTNRLAIEKGVQRIKKESAAMREFAAHEKDMKKGTGDKYLKKAVQKNKIDDTYEKIQSDSSRMDRFVYNDATRKKAAKYVVTKNMSVAEATKKAKQAAWRNTAISAGLNAALVTAFAVYQHKNGNK